MALGDKIIANLADPVLGPCFRGFTRELGWPTLALAHLYDITGEERYAKQLDEILEFLMTYQRPPGFEKSLVPGLWAMSCLFEGADLYQRRTGRQDIHDWLVEFIDKLREAALELHRTGMPLTTMVAVEMAIGYERTGDPRYLQAGMLNVEELLDSPWWVTPSNETKPMAVTYRGLIRFLHHAQRAGLLEKLEYRFLRESVAGGK